MGRITALRRRAPWLVGLGLLAVVAVLLGSGLLGGRASRDRPDGAAPSSSGPTTDPTDPADDGPSDDSGVRLSSRDYNPGDCLSWDQEGPVPAGGRTAEAVSCDAPHLLEVTSAVELRGLDRYPDHAAWDAVLHRAECHEAAQAYLGRPLDPAGRFGPGGIQPTAQGWSQGDRTVWCAILARPRAAAANPGLLVPFTGPVRGQDQSTLYPDGACLVVDDTGRRITGEVPCSAPHAYQVTGTLDVAPRFPAEPPPPAQEQTRVLAGDCQRAALSWSGSPLPDDVKSVLLPIAPESWLAGRRLVQCAVARFDAAGAPVLLNESLRPPR